MRDPVLTRLPLRLLDPAPADPALLAALCAEGEAACDAGWRSGADGTGLVPAQRTTRGELGPVAAGWLHDGRLLEVVCDVAGCEVQQSWRSSCYTRYERGDFLAPHVDDPAGCTVAVLLYLSVRAPANPGLGLALDVFDEQDGANPVLRVTARPGRLVVLLGSQVRHGRRPLATGERVTLLSACFRSTWS